jgi:hypothetical protein
MELQGSEHKLRRVSYSIRTRRPATLDALETYETESAAVKALNINLTAHRAAGHTTRGQGGVYIVTDVTGAFISRYELVRGGSRPPLPRANQLY